eukprot:803936-Prorocentrum_minimum.AAC.6
MQSFNQDILPTPSATSSACDDTHGVLLLTFREDETQSRTSRNMCVLSWISCGGPAQGLKTDGWLTRNAA